MEWPNTSSDPNAAPYVPPLDRLQQPPLTADDTAPLPVTEPTSAYPTTPPINAALPSSPPLAAPEAQAAVTVAPVEPVPQFDRGRRWPKVFGLVVVMAVLAGGGVLAGWLLGRDASEPEIAVQPELTPVADDGIEPVEPEPPIIDDSPGPVDDLSVEPVIDVADAVLPSVVGISTDIATGSGIVYDAERNLIVTNAHVVEGVDVVDVKLHTNQIIEEVPIVGRDADRDVALLRVPDDIDLAPIQWASRGTVDVGQLAVAVGSPFGLDQTVTAGIVSAVDRVVPSFGGGNVAMIQTDAPINPGNSGGALVDRQGRVIGMNTSIRTSGATNANAGVGFAVPSETVTNIAERILAGQPLDNGFLGINGADPGTGEPGALITVVTEESPAHEAGLQVGDLIVVVDGNDIASMRELQASIQLSAPGTLVELEILRDGDRFGLNVVLAEQPAGS